MRKFGWIILVFALFLTGCQSVPTFETLGNVLTSQEAPEPRQYTVSLPENAALQTVQSDAGKIFFCDGYEILLETLPAGNLDSTVTALSGFHLENLTLMETKAQGYACYECAWTSVGEGGFQTARTKILDDGVWHYALTVLAPADAVSQLQDQWQALFDSFGLSQS